LITVPLFVNHSKWKEKEIVIAMRSLRRRSNLPCKCDCFTHSVHSQWRCFF